MRTALIYDPAMAGYDLGPSHPLKPERFTLSVELMRSYGLIGGEDSDAPLRIAQPAGPAPDADLLLVHDAGYIETVIEASADPEAFRSRTVRGIGPGDTPAAPGLHEAAALIAGGTATGLALVLDAPADDLPARAFAPAGGLHHAQRDRAAGFCVYNDCAVAIAVALRDRPGTRIAYLDIDAHHGDGVQAAFYDSPDVLTISLHESGRFLFPGTGFADETGRGAGVGSAINVPLPPHAAAGEYAEAFDRVVEPGLAAFAPDVLVAQCGADTHRDDPLTHLGLTLGDLRDLYRRVIGLADRYAGGRLLCTGGGGYGTYSVVPRAWTILAAELAGVTLPEELPEEWRAASASLSGRPAPATLTGE